MRLLQASDYRPIRHHTGYQLLAAAIIKDAVVTGTHSAREFVLQRDPSSPFFTCCGLLRANPITLSAKAYAAMAPKIAEEIVRKVVTLLDVLGGIPHCRCGRMLDPGQIVCSTFCRVMHDRAERKRAEREALARARERGLF